jgi:hypothetical protein
VPKPELESVMSELMALQGKVAGITSAQHGPNIDLELKSEGFTHGFTMAFDSREALETYHTHPAHQAAGARLVAICENGGEGIMVFDLDIFA